MIEQRSEQWFASRVGKITGSRMSALFAKGRGGAESSDRRNYRAQLACERLTGKPTESSRSTLAMKVGVEREPDAIALYQAVTGELVTAVSFLEIPGYPAGASPDGLIDLDGALEAKCPNAATHIDYMRLAASACPSEYVYQVQAEIWAANRQWCDFISYCPDLPAPANLIIRRVARDDKLIDSMRVAIKVFNDEIEEEMAMIQEYILKAVA